MGWWTRDQERWDREVREMALWFPVSQWSERNDNRSVVRLWEIIVEPIPPPAELLLVLADLDRDGPIDMELNGKIRHSSRCHADHRSRDELRTIQLEDKAFLIELSYREPPGYPIAICAEPEISKITLPGHKHFYNQDIICPLFPPDETWHWRKNTAADYMVHVAVWLLKTAVWIATKEKCGKGTWIGAEVDHSLSRIIRTDARDDCPCGSGRKYRQCCMKRHILMRS